MVKAMHLFRVFYLTSLLLGLTLPVVGHVMAAPLPQPDQSTVLLLTFEGAVTPVLQQYVEDGIEAAEEVGATALILQLDTPGGSVDVTKNINRVILESPIPIVVYVAPTPARAASAGTFITLSAHVAAMAPGSSIGAASPVGMGGEDVNETAEAKAKNILSADIENLAERRGEEAVEWAVAAVQEAAAATADRALEIGIIDFVAADVADLLSQMDGFTVTVQGDEIVLATQGALIQRLDLNPLQQFLNLIANPTVAAILLTLGSVGLIAELYDPGAFVPGTIGLISLLLGLYALGQLEANAAGLALVILAVVLFVAEAITPTFGALAVGGSLAFIFGTALLFDAPGLDVPWATIVGLGVGMGLFAFFAGAKGLAAQRRQPHSGSEGMIGKTAEVRRAFDEEGQGSVLFAGELWDASLEESARGTEVPALGDRVTIQARRGYMLIVRGE